jgi:hypothetical protein
MAFKAIGGGGGSGSGVADTQLPVAVQPADPLDIVTYTSLDGYTTAGGGSYTTHREVRGNQRSYTFPVTPTAAWSTYDRAKQVVGMDSSYDQGAYTGSIIGGVQDLLTQSQFRLISPNVGVGTALTATATLAQTGTTVVVTTSSAHGFTNNAQGFTHVFHAGATVSAYNGVQTVIVLTTTTYQFQAAAGLGSATIAANLIQAAAPAYYDGTQNCIVIPPNALLCSQYGFGPSVYANTGSAIGPGVPTSGQFASPTTTGFAIGFQVKYTGTANSGTETLFSCINYAGNVASGAATIVGPTMYMSGSGTIGQTIVVYSDNAFGHYFQNAGTWYNLATDQLWHDVFVYVAPTSGTVYVYIDGKYLGSTTANDGTNVFSANYRLLFHQATSQNWGASTTSTMYLRNVLLITGSALSGQTATAGDWIGLSNPSQMAQARQWVMLGS